jgi:PKD repeat protein
MNYLTVNESPVASFYLYPNSGQAPLPVIFSNLSTGSTQYIWNFGDGNTSTDFEPFNIYTNNGTYLVSLISANTFCPADTCIDTVFVGISNSVITNIENLKIYPNPASLNITIEGKNLNELIEKITILTTESRIIQPIKNLRDSGTLLIDTKSFKQGTYYLDIEFKDHSIKLIPFQIIR